MNKTLQIQIFSYWHTGSGMGKGPELDATVIRDFTGLPYLPGRTIKGLLREALLTCEQLGHIPEQTTERICGLPEQEGTLSVSNGLLEQTERKWLSSPAAIEYLPGMFDRFSSTRLTEGGTACETSLRSIELCIPLTLFSEIEMHPKCEENLAAVPSDWLAIKTACSLIRSIGANRSRGLGRCQIELTDKRDK